MRLLILLLLVILMPNVACAKVETIYASFKYKMTDNDSKNDARRFAFIEAKKLAIEKAGSFLENEPRVKDYSISKYEIKSYIGSIIDVHIDKEEFDASLDYQGMTVIVKAVIDVEPVLLTISIICTDIDFQKKIVTEQKHLRELEIKLNDIQKRLYEEDKSDKAIRLRKYRADILTGMSENKSESASEIDKLKNNMNMTSEKVIKNVRNGMTKNELRNMLGKPRHSFNYNDKSNNKSVYCENYGKYWVIIGIDNVIGYIPYNSFNGCNADISKQLIAFEDLMK